MISRKSAHSKWYFLEWIRFSRGFRKLVWACLVCWGEVSVSERSEKTSHLCLVSSRQTGSEGSLGSHWVHSSWILSISKKCFLYFQIHERKYVIKEKNEINWIQTLLCPPLSHKITLYPSHYCKHRNTNSHGLEKKENCHYQLPHHGKSSQGGRAALHLSLQPSYWLIVFTLSEKCKINTVFTSKWDTVNLNLITCLSSRHLCQKGM